MRTAKVSKKQRHIVAMGGAFKQPAVLNYALQLTGKRKPHVLILETASGDAVKTFDRTLKSFRNLSCTIAKLGFFTRTPRNLASFMLSFDMIFVGGGNTKSMLAVWREYGLDKILKKAWKRGIVLCGSSAGGICWFDACSTDSWADVYTTLPALGFLKGSCCPHYNADAKRRDSYHSMIEDGLLTDGLAIDESVGVHFVGKKLHEVVTTKAGTGAYVVRMRNGEAEETALPARLIPGWQRPPK